MNRREMFGILAAAPMAAIGVKAIHAADGAHHGWTMWSTRPLVDKRGHVYGLWQRWDADRQQMLVSPTIGPVQWVEETGEINLTGQTWSVAQSDVVSEAQKETAKHLLEREWARR